MSSALEITGRQHSFPCLDGRRKKADFFPFRYFFCSQLFSVTLLELIFVNTQFSLIDFPLLEQIVHPGLWSSLQEGTFPRLPPQLLILSDPGVRCLFFGSLILFLVSVDCGRGAYWESSFNLLGSGLFVWTQNLREVLQRPEPFFPPNLLGCHPHFGKGEPLSHWRSSCPPLMYYFDAFPLMPFLPIPSTGDIALLFRYVKFIRRCS